LFQNEDLKNHLEESYLIQSNSLVLAEFNLNLFDNIFRIGNYRYRPTESGSLYKNLISTFDKFDNGNYYTDATDADIVIDGGYNDDGTPSLFVSKKQKMSMLYSLEDCLKPQRPRSGINKAVYFNDKYTHNSSQYLASRPRYYMADKTDNFKYWTSFRTEDGKERGISNILVNGKNYIDDASPYVVYKNNVPANRLVIKMQTNVGNVNLGPFSDNSSLFSDPFYGYTNQTTPEKWKVQILKDNNWYDAMSFDNGSTRPNGTPVVDFDGYLELSYSLVVPEQYRGFIRVIEKVSSVSMLPETASNYDAYIVVDSDNVGGNIYVWYDGSFASFPVNYGWQLENNEESILRSMMNSNVGFETNLVTPASYIDNNGKVKYRSFDYISGVRIVVETMNTFDSTFDLIEISPRLVLDLSDKTLSFSVSKIMSDLSPVGLPVGQLLASTGSLSLYDENGEFSPFNSNSLIYDYIQRNIKFVFYDIVNTDSDNYYVPIKTLYSNGIPQTNIGERQVNIELRDLYYYLESLTAPYLLLTDVSMSMAVSILLDSIGFTNYTFKRLDEDKDIVIPYFFVGPDKTVAQVLQDIAISTQTAMFFDEYNNFVVMSKNYIMPKSTERSTDLVLYGTKDESVNALENILAISASDNHIFNDGKIVYTTRYIQRSYGSIKQANMVDSEKVWIYKPALLWEVAASENTKSINGSLSNQSAYVLSAMPLNSNLSSSVPTVVNHELSDNTFDVGENIYWVARYNGYLYANGEIIKYDAVQFNVSGTGNVWISSRQEYENYFSTLPFNGKLYPTGLIRIYAEAKYEVVNGQTRLKNGAVEKHGRGQFGTTIVQHNSGLDSYWSNNDNVRGCLMDSEYLFASKTLPTTYVNTAGVSNSLAKETIRTGIIKNLFSNSFYSENDINVMKTTKAGTLQSSALVMTGPAFKTTEKPINFLSYVYKPLTDKYKHFGTRMRIVGKVDGNDTFGQTPVGSSTYYVLSTGSPDQNINVGGGSGGLGIMLNPSTNVGYYLELVALTDTNIETYTSEINNVSNVLFYKIKADETGKAVPVKLWSGLSNIIVDDGKFTGQYRMTGEENPTVYDLGVEYVDVGSTRRFYIYLNNKMIATVDDTNPLPKYNNMALFTRGSSKVMFENIYALTENYSENSVYAIDTPVSSIYTEKEVNANESFRRYAMSGIVQSTYLSGLSASQPPEYKMYFEEFGTIMRECAYFNIRYDKAYPALYAKLSPTFNKIKGYTVSGFVAGSYGAEFLIFNSTDTVLNLDETTGNYLRIQGITFTQDSTHELSVDDYYSNVGNIYNSAIASSNALESSSSTVQTLNDVKLSRLKYGKNDFSLDAKYIQTADDATDMMGWITSKVLKPRKSIGVQIFPNSTIQLGDIVQVYYKDNSDNFIIDSESRFIVYNISYDRQENGPTMTIFLSEVTDG
jgi:hypothetical protein